MVDRHETIPGIRFYQVKSLENKRKKKKKERNSSSRRNLYPRYPPLGARSCNDGRVQKVNSSRLWASISRRSELLPSRISAFVSHYPTIDHTRALERNPSLESQTRILPPEFFLFRHRHLPPTRPMHPLGRPDTPILVS